MSELTPEHRVKEKTQLKTRGNDIKRRLDALYPLTSELKSETDALQQKFMATRDKPADLGKDVAERVDKARNNVEKYRTELADIRESHIVRLREDLANLERDLGKDLRTECKSGVANGVAVVASREGRLAAADEDVNTFARKADILIANKGIDAKTAQTLNEAIAKARDQLGVASKANAVSSKLLRFVEEDASKSGALEATAKLKYVDLPRAIESEKEAARLS